MKGAFFTFLIVLIAAALVYKYGPKYLSGDKDETETNNYGFQQPGN